MKALSVLLLVLAAGIASAEHQKVDLTIFGMDCGVCAHTLRQSLGKVQGVEKADVSINQGVASVSLKQGNQVTLDHLRELVKGVGFLPKDAGVITAGTVDMKSGAPVLHVTGLTEKYDLEVPADAKSALENGAFVIDGIIHPDSRRMTVRKIRKP